MVNSTALVVSSLPPSKCGLASYAAEHIENLKNDYASVNSVGILSDSVGNHTFTLTSLVDSLRLLIYALLDSSENVFVHYADAHYFSWQKWKTPVYLVRQLSHALTLYILGTKAEKSCVIIHEMHTNIKTSRFHKWLRYTSLVGFKTIAVHTPKMKNDVLQWLEKLQPEQLQVIEHTQFMSRRFSGSKKEAKMQLKLSSEKIILLCMGFIQESKGFHDVVNAFAKNHESQQAELHIVGSMQNQNADTQKYFDELTQLCKNTKGVSFHDEYIDDVVFDCWLAAADVVFLPYLGVASSGVGARATLYGTKLVIRNLQNLTEQFPAAEKFSNQSELQNLINKFTHHHPIHS